MKQTHKKVLHSNTYLHYSPFTIHYSLSHDRGLS